MKVKIQVCDPVIIEDILDYEMRCMACYGFFFSIALAYLETLTKLVTNPKDMQGKQNLAPRITSPTTGIVIEIRITFCTVLVF